jgi:HSP20 family protein
MKIVVAFITYNEASSKYLSYFLDSLFKALENFSPSSYLILARDNSELQNNPNQEYIDNNINKSEKLINFTWSGANLGFAKAYNIMTLTKWNNKPTNSIFDRTLDNFLNNDFGLLSTNHAQNIPAVNIQENETEYRIELAVPYLKKEDIKVRFNNGLLSISAEQKQEVEDKKDNYTHREFSYQNFKRNFKLPEIINEEAIDAKYEEGVLKVIIPKEKKLSLKDVKLTLGNLVI